MQQRSQLAAALAALATGFIVSACGADPTSGDAVTAALTAGTVATIDTFDDGDVSDWVEFASPGSTMFHRLSSSRATSGTTSMKFEYQVAAGGFGGVEKVFATRPDWSTATSLSVWVNGLATGHQFGVQIYDAGGERWETSFAVDFTGWRNVVLPFASFTRAGWQPSTAQLNGVRDLRGMEGMSLLPRVGAEAAMGSVYLDTMTVGNGTASTTAAPVATLALAPRRRPR